MCVDLQLTQFVVCVVRLFQLIVPSLLPTLLRWGGGANYFHWVPISAKALSGYTVLINCGVELIVLAGVASLISTVVVKEAVRGGELLFH